MSNRLEYRAEEGLRDETEPLTWPRVLALRLAELRRVATPRMDAFSRTKAFCSSVTDAGVHQEVSDGFGSDSSADRRLCAWSPADRGARWLRADGQRTCMLLQRVRKLLDDPAQGVLELRIEPALPVKGLIVSAGRASSGQPAR